jgi:hypothetical protein
VIFLFDTFPWLPLFLPQFLTPFMSVAGRDDVFPLVAETRRVCSPGGDECGSGSVESTSRVGDHHSAHTWPKFTHHTRLTEEPWE